MTTKIVKLLLFLIMVPALLSAAVEITGVTYNEEQSELVFQFNSQVQYDNIVLSGISLRTSSGTINLGDGATIKSMTDSDQIVISLLYSDGEMMHTVQKDEFEKATSKDNIFVLVDELVFVDASNEGNEEVVAGDSLLVNYNQRTSEPALTEASYDAETNVLELHFNEYVFVDETVQFQNIVVNNVALNIVGNEIQTAAASDIVLIGLGKEDQKAVEKNDLTGAKVSVANAFRDTLYNPSDATEVIITFEEDMNPLSVVSAMYDARRNDLTITFNEQILNPTETENFFPPGIIISDADTAHADMTLFGYNTVKKGNGDLDLIVSVPKLIQRDLETLMDTSSLSITVKRFTVFDLLDNGNIETADVPLSFMPDSRPLEVDLDLSNYDQNTNLLTIGFTDRLDVNSDADFTGISLMDPSNPSNIFTFEYVDDITINAIRKKVEIVLSSEQEAILESFTETQLLVEPFIVFSKSSNGNMPVTMDSMAMLNIVADSTAPVLQSIQYERVDGIMILRFDETVDRTTFNGSGVKFAGITLDNNGEVTDSLNSEVIDYKVSDASKSALSQISDADKISPKFDLNAGTVQNLAGLGNEAIVDQGDGELYLVGFGRFFWTKGKEKFPRGNQKIFASIRKIGTKADIFVADDQWGEGNNVTQADVDSMLYAFETSLDFSPLDNTYTDGGVYDLVTTIFGTESDVDENGKVTIFLFDVRDDYGADGRNDTNEKIYNPGYIESDDQESSEEIPLSNESDVLYIDSYPQHVVPRGEDDQFATGVNALADVFQKLVALNSYPNEERWLVEGFSSLCQYFATDEWVTFMEDEGISITQGNNLTFFVTEFATRNNQKNSFLFNLYMYEKYGLDYLTELMSYTAKTGIDRIDWVVSSTLDPGVSVADIYKDYAVACLVDHVVFTDTTETEVVEHKYGFINVDLVRPSVIGLGALQFLEENTGIFKPSTSWSYFYYQIAGYDVTGANEFNSGLAADGVVKINADDNAKIGITGVTQDRDQLQQIVPEFEIVEADLDDLNEGELPLQFQGSGETMTFRDNYRTMIVVMVNTSGTDATVALSNDVTDPDFAKLSVLRNGLIERYLDIYVTSNEALYNDVEEGPSIQLQLDANSLVDLEVEKKFVDGSDLNTYLYKAEYDFNTSGDYTFLVSARDLVGNEVDVDDITVGVAKIASGQDAQIEMKNGFYAQVNEQSLEAGNMLYAVKLPARNFAAQYQDGISDVYQIMTTSEIKSDFVVKIPYDEEINTEFGLYRFDPAKADWQPVSGTINTREKVVIAPVNSEGHYQLRKGASGLELLPENFVLMQNYPNPFNPTTNIRFAVPERSQIQITVFDILGQKVKTLIDKELESGFHTVKWNGKDSNGNNVASGVYFYSLISTDKVQTKKMVFIK